MKNYIIEVLNSQGRVIQYSIDNDQARLRRSIDTFLNKAFFSKTDWPVTIKEYQLAHGQKYLINQFQPRGFLLGDTNVFFGSIEALEGTKKIAGPEVKVTVRCGCDVCKLNK